MGCGAVTRPTTVRGTDASRDWSNVPSTSDSQFDRFDRIVCLLHDAIPLDKLAEYKQLCDTNQNGYRYQKVNGGTPRGYDGVLAVVTGYNNTRKDEAEIIEWIQDAQILAMQRGI